MQTCRPQSYVQGAARAGAAGGPGSRASRPRATLLRGEGERCHRPRHLCLCSDFLFLLLKKQQHLEAGRPGGEPQRGGLRRPGPGPAPGPAPAPARALLGVIRHFHLRRRCDGRVRVTGGGVVRIQLPVRGVQRLGGRQPGVTRAVTSTPPPRLRGSSPHLSPGFYCTAGFSPEAASVRAGRCGPCRWASAAGGRMRR